MQISTTNPATGKSIATYKTHTHLQMKSIILQASHAMSIWQQLGHSAQEACFIRLADLLTQKKTELAVLMTTEMGKPITEAIAEIEKCAFLTTFYNDKRVEWLAGYSTDLGSEIATITHEPLGVILGIMPWNFPFWQLFRFAIPTLCAQNAIVFKHAPITTGCGVAIADLFAEAGFPNGLVSQLIVMEDEVAECFVNPLIKGVSITGSERAGRRVASLAGLHLKKSVMELGGNDPYLVLDDADVADAARLIVQSRFSNCGQVCVAPKRVIATKPIYARLCDELLERAKAVRWGDPMLHETKLGPMARQDLRQALDAQVQETIAKGARCLIGGSVIEGPGFYYPPTVLVDVTPDMAAFHEELFGPVITCIEAKDEAIAIEYANHSRFGLGAGVFSSDLERAKRVASRLESGVVSINKTVYSHPAYPFGGIKNSGYGRELGREGILEFTATKAIVAPKERQ